MSKESIFTGLNNFEINSIVDIDHDEQFGFTDDEVMKLLSDYDRSERYPDVKEWYDGYHFGNADIYCPWDVINFAKKLVSDPSARPSAFWINSSGNDMVKRFVDKADQTTRDEIEKLVAGGFVEKQLRLDLTYDEIDNTIDNLWSVLFTTGYLTKIGEVKVPDSESYAYRLVIPNKEVREVFILQIQEWFKAVVAKDDDTMKLLSRAILDKDDKQIYKRDYFSKSLNERLDYYGLRIRNRSNAVFLELSDPNTFRIRELNISSNKALMTILNKEVSGELVFFGDDALEQVSHLLAKPDQTDMLSGTKLSASESKDGQEHDIASLQDYNTWAE